MPASAPFFPASKEPLVSFLPFWIEAVFSPKYQMFPSLSWAYQSSVISVGFPLVVDDVVDHPCGDAVGDLLGLVLDRDRLAAGTHPQGW